MMGIAPETQRELLLRFRDQADDAAKDELLRELAASVPGYIDAAFAEESDEVRARLAAAATALLDPIVTHIAVARIREGDGVDLIGETLDPDELEDELGADSVGKRACELLVQRANEAAADTVVTEATLGERTKIIEQISGLLFQLVRAHHIKGRFGFDHFQRDLDRLQDIIGRTVARISTMVRGFPDKVIREEADAIEERVLADGQLLETIEFDPREAYWEKKEDAARVAGKAAAAREAKRRMLAQPRPMTARKPRTTSRTSTRARAPARRTFANPVPPPPPKPYVPSVLESLSPPEEQRLQQLLRDNSQQWSLGDAVTDDARRDAYWDPVTDRLEGLEIVQLKQLLALIKERQIHVARGFHSEIERVLANRASDPPPPVG